MKKLRSLFAIILVIAILSTFTVVSASAATTVNTEAALTTAVADGGDIVLGANIQLSGWLEIDKNVTLDLNGKTITTASGKSGLNINAGDVVINDSVGNGKIESSSNTPVIIYGGSLVINGGTFYSGGESSIFGTNAAVYNKDASASLTINNGTFTAPKTHAVYNIGTLVIKDGEFSSDATDLYMSTVYTSAQAPATATIEGGKFSISTNRYTIANYGSLTISGGEFTAPAFEATALHSGGNTVITKGTFIAEKGVAITCNSGTIKISDCIAKGMVDGLYIENGTAELNGGTYSSNFYMTLQEFTDSLPEADKSMASVIYGNYNMISAGISYVSGTDLLGFLGSDYKYYSKSGINQITVDNDNNMAKTEAIVAVDNIDPAIIEGADQQITIVSIGSEIISNVDYKYFFDGTNIIGEVQIDGKTVDPKNYDHDKGSTKITFKEAYLKTLSLGKYKVAIISNVAGYKVKAETTLTINSVPIPTPVVDDEEVAQTGDNTIIATFVAASALSAAAFVSLKKKEQY